MVPADQADAAANQVACRFGIEDTKTRRKLATAIEVAITNRAPTVLLWRRYKQAWLVQVRPAREAAAAVVSLATLNAPSARLDPSVLTEIFELTQAEAEIAAELFQCPDLADIAAARRVRRETVRGQVKIVLRKAGVASQKELLLLLSKIANAESLRSSERMAAAI